MTETISHNELLRLFKYDPETGLFTRLVRLAANAPAGQVAGCFVHNKGYVIVKLRNRSYAAHRLAFFYMTGRWPADQLDHRDLNKQNNRWANLREADSVQNGRNKGPTCANKTGYKGVYVSSRTGNFGASIRFRGKVLSLGHYKKLDDAIRAYAIAAHYYHGEFARLLPASSVPA